MQLIKARLQEAQQRMNFFADKHRSKRHFEEGDWVFLRLQPYRQTSVAMRRNQKLAPKFFGTYKIVAKIGSVAYKLDLPSTVTIHPVFHVFMLKKKVGDAIILEKQLPNTGIEGQFLINC